MITGGNFLFQGISFTKLLLVEEPPALKSFKKVRIWKASYVKKEEGLFIFNDPSQNNEIFVLSKNSVKSTFLLSLQRFCLHILHMEWKKARKVIFYLVTFWSIYMSSSLRVTEFAGNEIPPNYKKERILKYC